MTARMNDFLCNSLLKNNTSNDESSWGASHITDSPCFWMFIPCWFLWIWTPFELYLVKKSRLKCPCLGRTVLMFPRPWLWMFSPVGLKFVMKNLSGCPCRNWLNQSKLVLLDVLVIFYQVEFFVAIWSGSSFNMIFPAFQLITFVLTFYLVDLNTRRGLRSSGGIFVFWLLFCVIWGTIIVLRSDKFQKRLLSSLPFLVKYFCMVICLILNFFAEPGLPDESKLSDLEKDECNQEEVEQIVYPERMSSFPSKVTFSFVIPLIVRGVCGVLERGGLWPLDPENRVETIYKNFCRQQLENAFTGKSVVWPLLKTNAPTLLLAAILKFAETFLLILELMCFFEVYLVASGTPNVGINVGVLVVLMASVYVLSTIAQYQHEYKLDDVCMRVQLSLIPDIYNKALKVPYSPDDNTTNLISKDVRNVIQPLRQSNLLIYALVIVPIACGKLWYTLGNSVLGGLATFVGASLLTSCISYKMNVVQKEILNVEDEHVKLLNEVLINMKAIKLNAWGKFFENKLKAIRKKKIGSLKNKIYLEICLMILWHVCYNMGIFVSFSMFAISTGNSLEVDNFFHAFLYFQLLAKPFYSIPSAVIAFSQGKQSMERIDDFLNKNELSRDYVRNNGYCHEDPDINAEVSVLIKNGTFSWQPVFEDVLHDICLLVESKSLVIINGPSSSGKSSLLAAILGEMHRREGHVYVNESIAYVPQQAWIQNATVRENILFNADDISNYNHDGNIHDRYWKVVKACALETDFSTLPDKDTTHIGDQGVTLSGGQKHRISLARAVYADKDLYLLDDTLSALDAIVSAEIFEQVIGPRGLLKDKTRILVTHSQACLVEADVVINMKDGKIGKIDRKNTKPLNELANSNYSSSIAGSECNGRINEEISSSALCNGTVTDENRTEGHDENSGLLPVEETPNIKKVNNYFKSVFILIPFCATLLIFYNLLTFKAFASTQCWKVQDIVIRNLPCNSTIVLKCNLQCIPPVNVTIYHGSTPMNVTNSHGRKPVNVTNSHGSTSVNVTDNHGSTAVNVTDNHGSTAVNVTNSHGSTPVNVTNSHGSTSVNVTDNHGSTAVNVTDNHGSTPVNVTDNHGSTPVNVTNPHGSTPVNVTNPHGSTSVNITNPHGSTSVNVTNSHGSTPVNVTNSHDNAPMNVTNSHGSTPMNVTNNHGNLKGIAEKDRSASYIIMLVFVLFSLFSGVFMLAVLPVMEHFLLNASCRIYGEMLNRVLGAPLSFIYTSRLGDVVTRFSTDIEVLDSIFPHEITQLLRCVVGVTFIFLWISRYEERLDKLWLPVSIIFILIMWACVKTNRQLKNHEVVTFSGVISFFSESYQGASSIRAYNVQQNFIEKFNRKVDDFQRCWHHFTLMDLWSNEWMEFFGKLYLVMVALAGIHNAIKGGEQESITALLLIFASDIKDSLKGSVKAAGRIVTNMVSFKRIREYQELSLEENLDPGNPDGECVWKITGGKLVVSHVSVRYPINEGQRDYVLKDITFTVAAGEKVGVVGRTGAGKSTLALVVFGALRSARGRGEVFIDGQDISQVPLSVLRSQMFIITQDPFIFSGTLRMNLDPRNTKSDFYILEAAKKFYEIQEFQELMSHGLDYVITDGGRNLSLGQKQVLCIVRAVLCKNKLLVMDEATSSMDPKMERQILEIVWAEMKESTVLIISHRLNSVLACDSIILIDKGSMIEFGPRENLMQSPDSMFCRMFEAAKHQEGVGDFQV